MATKLDATRVALDKGFTGVSDPTATLSSISKGMQDIASWKKGIDDAEIKLKTDTAQAYQDAKKLAAERMTGNKTVDAAILEALRSTQDRLYDNMKMVQKGMQTPTDNLIFRQNASSSYDILSSYLQDYDANFQQSLKEMQGYIDEKTGEYVKPTGGSLQAAIQKFNTTLGNPNLYKIVSSENGSLNLNLFKTKIDPDTNTRQLVLDENNNPIVDPSMSGIGASTLLKGKNQKALRVYMDDNINEALAKDTALSKAFQVMQTAPGYTGIVVDDARNNPEIKRLIDTAAISGTTTSEQRFSILADNMPSGQEQIPVMPNEVDSLKSQGVDLNEKVEYTYLDPETGETKTGTYNKYVTVVLDPMSNLFMPKETEEAKLASERIYKTAIYSGLERKITGKDRKPVSPTGGATNKKLLNTASDIFGAINKSYGGAKKDIDFAIKTLQNSSGYKFLKQEDIVEDGQKVGISFTIQDEQGNTRTDSVNFRVKDDNDEYVDATADEYGRQLYALFKTRNMPSYDKVKESYIKSNTFFEKLNKDVSRAYIPKMTKKVTTVGFEPVTLSTSLNKNNESAMSIIQQSLDDNEIITSTQYISDGEVRSLSNSITRAISAAATKYGKEPNVSVTPDVKKDKITIKYGDNQKVVIDLTLDTLKGISLDYDIKDKLGKLFEILFPKTGDVTEDVIVQGGLRKMPGS